MDVLFDTSVTDFDRGGTSRYAFALLGALERASAPVAELSMKTSWPWTARLPRAARLLVHDAAWVPRGAVAATRRAGAGLYHGAGFKVPPRAPFRTSVTIHDDTPWDDPPTARRYNRVYMRINLRAAAPRLGGAITSAAGTARAVEARLPALVGKLHVTPWGVDHDVFRPRPAAEVESVLSRLGITRPYILVVSPYGPRKNEARMLEAAGRLAAAVPGLSAVIVGRHNPAAGDPLLVVRCGQVDDGHLAALYGGAELLLYASLKEGFGLPVIEAMASGCAVVTSAGTVLEEVAGGAAVLVDPLDAAGIAAGCETVIRDANQRLGLVAAGRERAAGFTWEKTAASTLEAWAAMR